MTIKNIAHFKESHSTSFQRCLAKFSENIRTAWDLIQRNLALSSNSAFSNSLQGNWLLIGKCFERLCLEYGALWVTSETYWRYKTLWKGDNLPNKFHEVQLTIGTNKTRGLLETTCGLEHWDFPLWWGADALGGGLSGLRSPVSGLKTDNPACLQGTHYLWLVFPK